MSAANYDKYTLAVYCPKCKVDPGVTCRHRGGHRSFLPKETPHFKRVELARRVFFP